MAQNLKGRGRENRRNARAFALASKSFRNELAKGKTYPTLAAFCMETGLALKTLRKHTEEYDEALSRVANHSLEIDKGYSFRYPHAIEERILEALEDGPLELQEMIEILKFSGVSHGARHTHRCRLDRLLSANSNLYRYQHTNKNRRKFVIFSLEPMTRPPWDRDLTATDRRESTPTSPPVETPLIQDGRIVGKVVKRAGEPSLVVRYTKPLPLAG